MKPQGIMVKGGAIVHSQIIVAFYTNNKPIQSKSNNYRDHRNSHYQHGKMMMMKAIVKTNGIKAH